MSASPLLDSEALDQLRLLEQRRPGMLRGVALRYVGELASRIAGLEQALARGDASAIRELAHSLKGDSRLLGADRAGDVAEDLEYAARDGDLARCAASMPELRSVLASTEAALLALPECKGA